MFTVLPDVDTPVSLPPTSSDPPAETTDLAAVVRAATAIMAPLARRRGIHLSTAAVDGVRTHDDPTLLAMIISSALALIIRRARLGSVVTCILAVERGQAVFRLWEEGHQQVVGLGPADVRSALPHIGLDPLRRSFESLRKLARQLNGTITLSDRSSHSSDGVLMTLKLAATRH